MGRPFTEFIQSQALPWQDGRYGDGGSGLRSKMLSLDPDNGASSLLVEYPAGWTSGAASAPWHLDVDEEFFVLSGELTIDGVHYAGKSYAHLPAGFTRQHASSTAGAVVLTFYSGEPRVLDGAGQCDDRRLVTYVDGLAGEWSGNFHPQFPPGAGRKFLRRDPIDGEETWLLGTMPLRSGRRPERHPVVEEMYLLSGELVGPLGVMQAGCYFWRPPEEWHGPFGSLTGNLMLFRTKGGPLSTVYTEHEVEFTWTPEHRPILPAEFEPYGREPAPGCGCY
ncbi:cupin domain-containing protein [Micromonospora carbonacea]|uniref:DUF4437 domain-containing protein n=1 Tax=Micromonospora carbonacea TaxID=47853 RepID=A0A1C4V8I9_9ACTN|nr:DUF4437 domain-containing protein [Micromonospora carbonacea]SCE80308.1 protein of unknown function (DUF4437) [Micromonospora carbonacea]